MDIDMRTGAPISNEASALQSVEILLATRIGERVMLREFGAGVSDLLGRLMTPRLLWAFMILLAAAIDLWEPRFRVRRIVPSGSVDAIRRGHLTVRIEVDWRPRAHLGDPSVEGITTFGLGIDGRGISLL